MSKTISVETAINAPLNKVWDEVSQIQNHSNWMKDAVKMYLQNEGPFQKASHHTKCALIAE